MDQAWQTVRKPWLASFGHFDFYSSFSLLYSLFGKPDAQYDFDKGDIHALQAHAAALQKVQEANKKKVNLKVMDMIERYTYVFLFLEFELTY